MQSTYADVFASLSSSSSNTLVQLIADSSNLKTRSRLLDLIRRFIAQHPNLQQNFLINVTNDNLY